MVSTSLKLCQGLAQETFGRPYCYISPTSEVTTGYSDTKPSTIADDNTVLVRADAAKSHPASRVIDNLRKQFVSEILQLNEAESKQINVRTRKYLQYQIPQLSGVEASEDIIFTGLTMNNKMSLQLHMRHIIRTLSGPTLQYSPSIDWRS